MATIIRRTGKSGQLSFRAQVRRKGARPLSATFTKLSDTRKWIQITEAGILEGRHFKVVEAKRHTLAEMVDRYVENVLRRKRAWTIAGQTIELAWWRKHLGYYTLADITPALIVEHRDKLAGADGIRCSNSTLNRYTGALSHAFTIAVKEWNWLDLSPMRNVSKLKEPRGRVRFLSDDERHRLLEACKVSKNSSLYTIVVLALSTGARKMEIVGLHWSSIDFQRQVMTLHETKNAEIHVVPLTGYALELMRHRLQNRRTDTDLVFPRENGTLPMSSVILGHKTLQMTKRYGHLSEAHTAGIVARMNAAIFGQ